MHLDGGDVLRARTIILACGVAWRHLAIDGFDRLAGKGISYGAARSEASNTHGLDVHIVGAGNSAGQAALFFSTHARSVTILCRGDSAREEHVALPRSTSSRRGRTSATLFGAEVAAVHGEVSLEAIDVRDRATAETTRLDSGGLFIFIGADAQTGWLPPEIALDRQRLRAHRLRHARGGTLDARPRPLPAGDERSRASSPAATCASAR